MREQEIDHYVETSCKTGEALGCLTISDIFLKVVDLCVNANPDHDPPIIEDPRPFNPPRVHVYVHEEREIIKFTGNNCLSYTILVYS